MKYDEFNEVFEDFVDSMDGKYSLQQRVILWNYVKYVSKEEFKYQLNTLLESHYKAPPVGKLKAQLREATQRAKLDRRGHLLEKMEYCPSCRKTGLIFALSASHDNQTFALKCPYCEAAEIRGLSREFVIYDPKRHSDLKPIRSPMDKTPLEQSSFINMQRESNRSISAKGVISELSDQFSMNKREGEK